MRTRNLVGLAVSVALASPALAQTQLEEIVVTAQKRAETAQDVGIAIAAFDGEQFAVRGLNQPQDLSSQVPNLYIKNTSGSNAPVFTLRGVGVNDFVTNAPPSVGVYVDEVFQSNSGMMSSALFDMERVEVVKGPQGDLFGRNTNGGFVSFITRKPTREFEASTTLEVGNYDALRVEGAIGGPLSDTLSARLAVLSRNQYHGWFTNFETGKDHGRIQQAGWRLALDWHPSDRLDAYLNVHGGNDRSDNYYYMNIGIKDPTGPTVPARIGPVYNSNCAGTTLSQLRELKCTNYVGYTDEDDDPFTGRSNIEPFVDTDLLGTVLRIEYDLGFAQLTSLTAYDDFKRNTSEDTDASPSRFIEVTYDSTTRQFYQELRLTSTQKGFLDWIAGANYAHDNLDTFDIYYYTDRPFRDTDLIVAYTQETTSYAAFAHGSLNFTESIRGVLGLRYNKEKRTWIGGTIDMDPLGASAFLPPYVTEGSPFDPTVYCPGSELGTYLDCNLGQQPAEKVDDSDVMYRAGLEFRPVEDVLVYATYSTGIKSGAFSGTWSDLAGGHLPSRKEEVKSTEIGVKSVLANRSLRLNAAAFHYDYVDLQGLAFDPVLFKYGLDNIGDARIQGFEADLEWRPVDGLDLRASYGYVDTELTKSNPVLGNDYQVGNRLPNAPRTSLNAEVAYEWAVAGGVLAVAGVDAHHQSDVYFNIDNDGRAYQEGYTVVNARVGLKSESDKWNATAWIRNAADKEYFQEAFISSGANVLGNVGAPRTYGLTLTYRFD